MNDNKQRLALVRSPIFFLLLASDLTLLILVLFTAFVVREHIFSQMFLSIAAAGFSLLALRQIYVIIKRLSFSLCLDGKVLYVKDLFTKIEIDLSSIDKLDYRRQSGFGAVLNFYSGHHVTNIQLWGFDNHDDISAEITNYLKLFKTSLLYQSMWDF